MLTVSADGDPPRYSVPLGGRGREGGEGEEREAVYVAALCSGDTESWLVKSSL